jgi:hypothetical protein
MPSWRTEPWDQSVSGHFLAHKPNLLLVRIDGDNPQDATCFVRPMLLRLLLGICRETEKHERLNSQGTHVIAPFEPTNLAMNKQQALALPIPILINEIVKADFKKLITP